jgi:hypothetical protein
MHECQPPAAMAVISQHPETTVPVQLPAPSHWSDSVHESPSSQVVPDVAKAFVGHAAELPVQLSSTSHSSTADLHTVEVPRNPSAGQSTSTPLQCSSASQSPAEALQRTDVPDVVCVQVWVVTVSHVSSVQSWPSLHSELSWQE